MRWKTWALRPMRWVVTVAAVAMIVAGCGPAPPSGMLVHRETAEGAFVLALDLPRDAWNAGEVIAGTATLLAQGAPTIVWGSGGGIIGFEFTDSSGTYRMQPAWRLDCAAHPLAPGSPETSGIWMSGAWDGAQPGQLFAVDGKARLPAGDWDITAVAAFGGDGCRSETTMRTTVRVHVIGPPGGQ